MNKHAYIKGYMAKMAQTPWEPEGEYNGHFTDPTSGIKIYLFRQPDGTLRTIHDPEGVIPGVMRKTKLKRALKGLGLGALSGGVIGAGTGIIAAGGNPKGALLGAPVGALLGGGYGALLGANTLRERR